MINDGMLSSSTDLWETPQAFFDKYNSQYHFDVDVCALPTNAKVRKYYTPEQDGLSKTWTGICWMNPPYGRQIGKWVQKAYESALGGGNSSLLTSGQN